MNEKTNQPPEERLSIDYIFRIGAQGDITQHTTGHDTPSDHHYLVAWVVHDCKFDPVQFKKYLSERVHQHLQGLGDLEESQKLDMIRYLLPPELTERYEGAKLLGPMAPRDAIKILTDAPHSRITDVRQASMLSSVLTGYQRPNHSH